MQRAADPPDQQHRTPAVPPSPGSSPGVSLLRESHRDFSITQLIERLEFLQVSEGLSTVQEASSARSSIVRLAHEPTTCRRSPESARVLRHHHNSQLRMLTHRWKMLGLQPPVIGNSENLTSKHLIQENKTEIDSPLKITALQTGHGGAPREERWGNSSSDSSDAGVPRELEVKGNSVEVPVSSNSTASEQSNSDNSDLSDQERGRAQVLKWSAPVELHLRPEPYNNDLDSSYSTQTADLQVYPPVLPAPLKDLDFTQAVPSTDLSADSQQKLFTADPCLAPLVARLLELEKLQASTAQKERAKRPTTAKAQTKNATRPRNSELPVSKSWSSEDAECSSVTCSFTKLGLTSPNTSSSCRCRRDTCPLTKLRHGSREVCLQQYHTLLNRPHTLSGKPNRPAALLPAFSISIKTSPKPKTPNRTRRPRTTKKSSSRPQRDDSTSARKTRAASSRKTGF